MLSKNVLYYGREDPLPKQMTLRAGPLTAIFEAGDLRYIRLGDQEILRRVYVAVRDQNWGTIPSVITNLQTDVRSDSFRIAYDVANRQDEIDFTWRGVILGEADGTITFSMDGTAHSAFVRNRIGFCILHPASCAGKSCVVEQVSGQIVRGVFPKYISPHQPFLEMRSISHQVTPGVDAKVAFDGDIFEMEDQRNWTDASYKTYSTPLRIPYPVRIEAGTTVSQSVTVTLSGTIGEPAGPAAGQRTTLEIAQAPSGPLPDIGLGLFSPDPSIHAHALERLKALSLGHLRVDLDLAQPQMEDTLRAAWHVATTIGAGLELAVFVGDAAANELAHLAATLNNMQPSLVSVAVFHRDEPCTSAKWVALRATYLRAQACTRRLAAAPMPISPTSAGSIRPHLCSTSSPTPSIRRSTPLIIRHW